jgi:hypothetical protein
MKVFRTGIIGQVVYLASRDLQLSEPEIKLACQQAGLPDEFRGLCLHVADESLRAAGRTKTHTGER